MKNLLMHIKWSVITKERPTDNNFFNWSSARLIFSIFRSSHWLLQGRTFQGMHALENFRYSQNWWVIKTSSCFGTFSFWLTAPWMVHLHWFIYNLCILRRSIIAVYNFMILFHSRPSRFLARELSPSRQAARRREVSQCLSKV